MRIAATPSPETPKTSTHEDSALSLQPMFEALFPWETEFACPSLALRLLATCFGQSELSIQIFKCFRLRGSLFRPTASRWEWALPEMHAYRTTHKNPQSGPAHSPGWHAW